MLTSTSSPTSELEWATGTTRLVESAKQAHDLSAVQRTRAFDTQVVTQLTVSRKVSASCKALEEKIQQSTALMSIATKERDIISHTKRQLDESIVAMQTTMMLLQDPLSTGQEVEMLREERPENEATRDHASFAISELINGCNRNIRALAKMCEAAEKDGSKLALCRATLEQDMADKAESIRLDKEALGLSHSSASAELTGRVRAPGHPMQWQLHTDNLVAEARRVRAGSERLRDRARALVEETHRVQQCTCDASLRALQVRNKEVQKLKAEVGDVHAGVCRELQTLETAMHSVVRSEKSLEHPMQVAQSRQSHRTVRPAPECVFDAAEQSLEREISDLGRSRDRLGAQFDAQSRRYEELQASKAKTEKDAQDKSAALAIDARCIQALASLQQRMAEGPAPLPPASGRSSPVMALSRSSPTMDLGRLSPSLSLRGC